MGSRQELVEISNRLTSDLQTLDLEVPRLLECRILLHTVKNKTSKRVVLHVHQIHALEPQEELTVQRDNSIRIVSLLEGRVQSRNELAVNTEQL